MAAAALVARMGRTVALSSDIATRVVYKRWFLEQTYETIAAELEIGTTTAWQIYQRFVQTDGVETFQGRRPNDPWNGLVSSHLREPLLRALTECDAESDLQDIADAFQRLTGVAVSTSAICRTSIAMGWTRKIVRRHSGFWSDIEHLQPSLPSPHSSRSCWTGTTSRPRMSLSCASSPPTRCVSWCGRMRLRAMPATFSRSAFVLARARALLSPS